MAYTNLIGRTQIDAPPHIPVKGGLLDVATVIDRPASARELRGVDYESNSSYAAEFVNFLVDNCVATATKNPEGISFETGDPFSIYAGVACSMFNGGDDFAAKATMRLEAAEHIAVEEYLWNQVLAAEAIDLTPAAGAVSPKIGLGLLEEYAARNYTSVPMVHFGRRLAVFLASEALLDASLETATLVGGAGAVNGAGYYSTIGPDGVEADDGEVWMYVTGHVVLQRGAITTTLAQNPQRNAEVAIAERTYVPTIDGLAAAILVTLTGDGSGGTGPAPAQLVGYGN